MTTRVAFFAAASMAAAVAGCGGGGKTYDISTIFPASDPAAKCARYHGDLQGSGITATCMVTKDECEKAAADWRQAMQSGGVNDAIQFSCK
jgi:hypothetical protein